MATRFVFRRVPELADRVALQRSKDRQKDEAYLTAYAIAAVRQELPSVNVPGPVKTIVLVGTTAGVVFWPKLEIVGEYARAIQAQQRKSPAEQMPVGPQQPDMVNTPTPRQAEPARHTPRPGEYTFLHGAPDKGTIQFPEG